MNVNISGLSGVRDIIIASGVRHLLEGTGLDLAVSFNFDNVPEAAAAPIPIAAPPPGRTEAAQSEGRSQTRAAQIETPRTETRRPAEPRPRGSDGAPKPGADPRGTRRDAVRAALKGASGKNYFQLENELKPIWPELDRSMISTIVCQLAQSGECEQVDGKWKLVAAK